MKYAKRNSSDDGFVQAGATTLTNAYPNNVINKVVVRGTGKDAYLLISAMDAIYRVPVQSCTNYTSCVSCLTSSDPYCTVDRNNGKCLATDSASDNVIQQRQDNPQLCYGGN